MDPLDNLNEPNINEPNIILPPSEIENYSNLEIRVRSAESRDALQVGSILAEAFPTLYTWTFGRLENEQIVRLLCSLYTAGSLSLATTRLAEQDGRIIGVAILHLEGSIGQGTWKNYWRVVRQELRLWISLRAFLGGMFANFAITARIPTSPDLLYLEAIAVSAAFRGQGIGTVLLTDAEAWGRAIGRSRMALHVLQRNTGARRLYERFGFRLSQTEPLPAPKGSRRQQWVSLLMTRDDFSQRRPPSL